MLAMVFITFPGSSASRNHVPWYDIAIMVVIAVIFGYFAWNAERIVLEAWEYVAPPVGVTLALITWPIILEAGRRAGGWPIFCIVTVLSLYPMYSDLMPDVIAGIGMPVDDVAIFHILGEESLFGIPMQAFAMLVSVSCYLVCRYNIPPAVHSSSILHLPCWATSAGVLPRLRFFPADCWDQ